MTLHTRMLMRTIELFDAEVRYADPDWKPEFPVTLAESLEKRTRRPVEASASNLGSLVAYKNHPFVHAVERAYSGHRPLTLSPDDVWLCIIEAFAMHVNVHPETLRDRLVTHQGQMLIEVRRDEFRLDSPENDWPSVFAEIAERIAEHIGDVAELVTAGFSTTSAVEKGVSQIVLMSAMQPYFKYGVFTLCGIPRITLLGDPNDWKAIRLRAARFAPYDLESWIAALVPVLDKLVSAAEGEVDTEFWGSMYKLIHRSGGPYVSGWINVFFPYILTGVDSGQLKPNPFMHTWESPSDARIEGPRDSQFPSALARAPFVWTYMFSEIPMEFLGGFVGVSQDAKSRAFRPAIGWAVRRTADVPLSATRAVQ